MIVLWSVFCCCCGQRTGKSTQRAYCTEVKFSFIAPPTFGSGLTSPTTGRWPLEDCPEGNAVIRLKMVLHSCSSLSCSCLISYSLLISINSCSNTEQIITQHWESLMSTHSEYNSSHKNKGLLAGMHIDANLIPGKRCHIRIHTTARSRESVQNNLTAALFQSLKICATGISHNQ